MWNEEESFSSEGSLDSALLQEMMQVTFADLSTGTTAPFAEDSESLMDQDQEFTQIWKQFAPKLQTQLKLHVLSQWGLSGQVILGKPELLSYRQFSQRFEKKGYYSLWQVESSPGLWIYHLSSSLALRQAQALASEEILPASGEAPSLLLYLVLGKWLEAHVQAILSSWPEAPPLPIKAWLPVLDLIEARAAEAEDLYLLFSFQWPPPFGVSTLAVPYAFWLNHIAHHSAKPMIQIVIGSAILNQSEVLQLSPGKVLMLEQTVTTPLTLRRHTGIPLRAQLGKLRGREVLKII